MFARAFTMLWRFLISLSKGAPVPPRGSAVPYGTRWRFSRATAIGYASLPFFAKNLLISAFVGSRKRYWLSCTSGPVGLGTVHEMAGKKSLTTGRHASRPRIDAGGEHELLRRAS